jgi:DnaJ like chaperone protein
MSIWVRIGEFVTSVASNAITGVIEAVRTVFEGDADTRRRVAFSIAMIALSAKMAKRRGCHPG